MCYLFFPIFPSPTSARGIGARKGFSFMREFAGGMERSILRNPKLQAPNYKQISNSNIGPPDTPPCGRVPSFNDQNTEQVWNFEFDYCDLFDICDLWFGISDTPVLQNSSQSLLAKPYGPSLRCWLSSIVAAIACGVLSRFNPKLNGELVAQLVWLRRRIKIRFRSPSTSSAPRQHC